MFRFRINPEIRKQVEEVYAKNGLTFTEIKTNSLHRRRFKICLAINKEKAAQPRGANDNFLITVRFPDSFVPFLTVLFVVERG